MKTALIVLFYFVFSNLFAHPKCPEFMMSYSENKDVREQQFMHLIMKDSPELKQDNSRYIAKLLHDLPQKIELYIDGWLTIRPQGEFLLMVVYQREQFFHGLAEMTKDQEVLLRFADKHLLMDEITANLYVEHISSKSNKWFKKGSFLTVVDILKERDLDFDQVASLTNWYIKHHFNGADILELVLTKIGKENTERLLSVLGKDIGVKKSIEYHYSEKNALQSPYLFSIINSRKSE